MTFSRLTVRVATALVAFGVATLALLVAFSYVALAVDWDIPEGREMRGPSSVFDRNHRPLARFAAEIEARPVDLADIDESLQHAVIATEDHRFYEHEGVDPLSVIRAIVRNVQTGGIAEGGSTLTQQYVKNVHVGADRTFYRKIREAVVALQLEKERDKDEILEAYLNHVYFGSGAYGAEAAALTYFDVHAADLTNAQAATLAGTVSAPSRFSPRADPEGALDRRDRVLDRMARYGFISRNEADAAKTEPLGLAEVEQPRSPAPHFVEQVRRDVEDAYGAEKVYNGGLHIITTLDLDHHRALRTETLDQLPGDPVIDAGAVALDPSNGDILATYSGRDFETSQVDLALGDDFGQQTGSAFKPIVLATALEEGMDLTTTYPAPGSVTVGGTTVTGSGCGGGACTLLQATTASSNTVFFQLGRDVGQENFVRMAHRLGVRTRDIDDERHGIGLALGTADLTPLDMTSAFATFANEGVACPPRTVKEVRNPGGAALDPPDPRQPTPEAREEWAAHMEELGYDFGDEDLGRCYRAVAPSVAGKVNQALEAAVAGGTGRRAQIGRPQAGKTGTSDRSQHLWFVGYTPHLSLGVYIGAPEAPRPIALPQCGGTCFGGSAAAPIWAAAASRILEGVDPEPFPEPPPDERVHGPPDGEDDRRRLGPPTPSETSPEPRSEPEPEPEREPEPEPEPEPDPQPEPEPTPHPDPEHDEDDPPEGDDEGGILPPLPGE